MFAKLVALILGLGVIGCGLLAARQARLQAASELAQARLRVSRADDRLLTMRAQIGEAVTPARVEAVAVATGTLRPATNDIPRALLAKELRGLMTQTLAMDAPGEAGGEQRGRARGETRGVRASRDQRVASAR